MVTQYGMGTELMSKQVPTDDYAMSDYTRRQVDEEQQYLTDLAHRRALKMVGNNRPLLDALARTLLENEVLEREDIERIVSEYRDGGGGGDSNGQPPRVVPVPEPGKARSRPPSGCRTTSLRRLIRPVFGRIDHIGVAVEDLDEAIALYGERLGMPLQHRETVEEQGVEAVLLGVGDSHVELLRPLGPDTAVGKFLERSGPGLHHVAYGTDDIDSALDAVRGAGLRLIDERPRTGIRGSRVAFLHPKSTGGVLTELVEPQENH